MHKALVPYLKWINIQLSCEQKNFLQYLPLFGRFGLLLVGFRDMANDAGKINSPFSVSLLLV